MDKTFTSSANLAIILVNLAIIVNKLLTPKTDVILKQKALSLPKYGQNEENTNAIARRLQYNKPYGSDSKKMRKVMKKYKKELLEAFGFKLKIIYFLSVYMPFTYLALLKLKDKLRLRKAG